ncbi:MAG: phosphotransferase enzyme family protein [Granulosicoccus sp.]
MSELYASGYVEHLRGVVSESLAQWGFSADCRVALLTVSENATFVITDGNGQRCHVVRVHRPGYHTLSEIQSELKWIEALRREEVVLTPRPIPLKNGGAIASFQDGDETRYMVAFEFMLGEEPSTEHSLNEGFRQLGSITARLHQHVLHWKPPASFARKIWNFETTIGPTPHWGFWEQSPGLTAEGKILLARTVDTIKTRLDVYGAGPDRFGLIHADLRLANLLVDDDKLAVIDFDDCGFGWYAYDFAAAISFMEEDPQVPDLLQAWISGYRDVGVLSEEDEGMIPTFIMLRRIMLTAWLATHSETPTAQELGVAFLDGTLRMARNMETSGTPLVLEKTMC